MKLVLYAYGSQETAAVKLFLENHGLEFEEVDIQTPEGFRRLVKQTQQERAPALEIKRSHCVGVIVRERLLFGFVVNARISRSHENNKKKN